MKCVVCKAAEATQKHHLVYEPEPLIIDVCVDCHQEIHKHGVGRGRNTKNGFQEIAQTSWLPIFTSKDKDGFVIDKDTEEILVWLICPNGCRQGEWRLFGNESRRMYLRCNTCGVDYEVAFLERKKDAEIS